jgi:hypothetical protein
LQFLDKTLERIIQRFESEYPETRVNVTFATQSDTAHLSSISVPPCAAETSSDVRIAAESAELDADNDDDDDGAIRIPLRRNGSDVSLASRQAHEEGLMHRFGQLVRRDIFRPETLDHAHGTTGHEVEAPHLQDLRRRLESLDGVEIREKVERVGPDAMFEAIGATAKELAWLEQQDPEGLEALKEDRMTALCNMWNQGPKTDQGSRKV